MIPVPVWLNLIVDFHFALTESGSHAVGVFRMIGSDSPAASLRSETSV